MIYSKCACDVCGGHIEFPAEAAGRSVSCPHCGGTTVLNVEVAASAPRPRGMLKWIAVAIVCFAFTALSFVVIKVLFFGKLPRDVSAKVVSFERASVNNPGAVMGVVENRAGRSRQGVRVEIELLNLRGEPLWSTTAFTPAIEPNKSWNFRASVVDANAVTARVARVREFKQ